MKTIYKYPLDFGASGRECTLLLPRGAQILHCEEQRGRETVWALVDTDQPLAASVSFRLVVTGEPVGDDIALGGPWVHLATIQNRQQTFVEHIFFKRP